MAPMGNDAAERPTEGGPEHLVDLAVERTYTAFAGHRLGDSMEVWRADVTSADVAALAGPLRAVGPAAIDRWLPHAATTWGTPRDVQALVPRVLELLAVGRLVTPPEVLFRKLRVAGLPSWDVEEQAAVEDLITAVWLAALARYPSANGHPAWRLLVGLAELGDELSPFLDDWLLMLGAGGSTQVSARRHLRDLRVVTAELRADGRGVGDLFWTPRAVEVARLETWLASPFTAGERAS